MDAYLRAIGRRYKHEPSLINAQAYIVALERAGGAGNRNPLMSVWGSLVIGLLDPNGVSSGVYDALLALTTIIFGDKTRQELSVAIEAIDNRFFLEEGSERWLNSFLKRVAYQCDIPPSYEECPPCAAVVHYEDSEPDGRCTCPGCFKWHDEDDNEYALCSHHYDMFASPGFVSPEYLPNE